MAPWPRSTVFIEGWTVELIAPTWDAELDKTHAYALFPPLIPRLLLVWFNLVLFFNRGSEFQVLPDGSVSVRRSDAGIRTARGCPPRSVPSSSSACSPTGESMSSQRRRAAASPRADGDIARSCKLDSCSW